MQMGMEFRGGRELDRALGEMPRATAKRVLRTVTTGALEPMAQRAAGMAPEESGRLSFSIAISQQGTRRAEWRPRGDPSVFVMAMGPAGGLGALSYASFVEFGTVDTPAQPYMRPAWDGGKQGALDHVRTELAVEIRKVAERAGRQAARG